MNIDLNLLRAGVTVLSFAGFLGIIWWAMSRRNQADFDEAAQLPFLEDDTAPVGLARVTTPASLER
jgi:cytochrome c oxidase cbb3-type subunit 4